MNAESMNTEIKSLSFEELATLMGKLEQPHFRVNQLVEWIYGQGASNYQEMTNLPQSLRDELATTHPLMSPLVVDRQVSYDGTRKYILELEDRARIETVAIPNFYDYSNLFFDKKVSPADASSSKRLTACLSTQVGCTMGCVFCATGNEGFTRNLSPGEIVDQIHVIQRDFGDRVSNLVLMGQGEAFLNYENSLAALRFVNSPKGLAIGARHITISTCGILAGIKNLARESEQFTLAVSLHSAEQATRNSLMPHLINAPLSQLKEVLLYYREQSGRRVTFEYLLIQDINDSPEALAALVRFCDGLPCHVNLLSINSVSNNKFRPSTQKIIKKWGRALKQTGIPVSIRNSRGSDINGACGQLKNAVS